MNRRQLEPLCKIQQFIIFNQHSGLCLLYNNTQRLITSLTCEPVSLALLKLKDNFGLVQFASNLLSFGHVFYWR